MGDILTWRKSSYTGSNGGTCVEVAWRRSSYSTANGGACVEVAGRDQRTGVRDSKAPGSGELWFPAAAWRAFLTELR
ncbi:protein of unknown function [Amycolatopsis arida]|uniref:DUF397 domain-containing protein n=1 Tax=Amycolatopsis arida TaxID=587909 RepID=A0A1I5LNL6_9PSEU|nr:DUF397 domain-containing protein [Amycolatopsis arida]TDX93783.1 uncharacterized protein DUF397 [Amycolatopsis arida]SFO98802.1 protein of unknown function [Amycolatopsis arida]